MPTNSFIEIKKEKEKKEEILWEEVMLINSQHEGTSNTSTKLETFLPYQSLSGAQPDVLAE